MEKPKYTILLSLGVCCESTYAINYANAVYKIRRQWASPFNWLLTSTPNEMIEMLEKKFKPFGYLDDKIVPDLKMRRLGIQGYNIFMPHYNPIQWKELWPRRTQRFLDFIANANEDERILFVFKSHINSKMTQEQFDKLVEIFHDMNPNLQYDILVVNEFLKDEEVFEITSDEHLIYKPLIEGQETYLYMDADNKPYAIFKCDFSTSRLYWSQMFKSVLGSQ